MLKDVVLTEGDAACARAPGMAVSEINWVTLTILAPLLPTAICSRRKDEADLQTTTTQVVDMEEQKVQTYRRPGR
jgi:hypothetical protein